MNDWPWAGCYFWDEKAWYVWCWCRAIWSGCWRLLWIGRRLGTLAASQCDVWKVISKATRWARWFG